MYTVYLHAFIAMLNTRKLAMLCFNYSLASLLLVIVSIANISVSHAKYKDHACPASHLINGHINSLPLKAALFMLAVNDEVKQLTLDDAVAKVRTRMKGQVMSAEGQVIEGELVYRVKILTGSGQVKVVLVNAQTGNIVND